LVEPALLVAAALLAVATALPFAVLAVPLWLAFRLARAPWWAPAAVAGAAGAFGWGWAWWHGQDPSSWAAGYLDVQLETGRAILAAWPSVDWGALGPGYAGRVWPYVLAGGPLAAGALGAAEAAGFVSFGGGFSGGERNGFRTEDAGRLARQAERPVSWVVPNALGRGVVTLLSAPPGLGKGWWTFALLRAMQDGGAFFGLPVRRPERVARFGRSRRPMRVLWCTEEGESFRRSARRFGIAPGLVEVVRRDRVAEQDWPALVRAVRRLAWRKGCACVIFDTVRAWCPQAEQSNEQAARVFNLARAELAARGLGVLFVHHDRKGGGEYGEGVAGPNNLVGSTDVLIELRRVRGRDDARRMRISRRFGELDVTARLVGHRYVADGEAVGEAGADGGIPTPPGERRPALGAAAAPDRPEGAAAGPRPPLEGEAYRRYLRSDAWAARRERALRRAGGRCGRCGAGVPAEVHHLTYERLGAERDGDLIALCAPCHRDAHPSRSRERGALTPPVRRTLDRLEKLTGVTGGGRAVEEVETDELLRMERGSKSALLARLRALEGAGLAAHRGKGVRGDPQRWRATGPA
jgi:hypothetical protein